MGISSIQIKWLRLAIGIVILLPGSAAAQNAPQSFVYQGRLFSPNGTEPLLDVVDIVASIVDPSGNCLLYQQSFPNLDLNVSSGAFSLSIGSATGANARTSNDPGLPMSKVFGNNGTVVRSPSASCSAGYA